MSPTSIALAIFLASYTIILCHTVSAALNTSSSSTPDSTPKACPICFGLLATIDHDAIQINLPNCTHIFCADCLSRHVLAGYNTCPLCRAEWFEIPEGATTGQIMAQDAEDRIQALERLINLLIRDTSGVDTFADSEDSEEDEVSSNEDYWELEAIAVGGSIEMGNSSASDRQGSTSIPVEAVPVSSLGLDDLVELAVQQRRSREETRQGEERRYLNESDNEQGQQPRRRRHPGSNNQ